MREKHVCKVVLAVLFLVLFSFGLSWGQNPTMLVVVRGSDDSLWKMTCVEKVCSAFTNFPGMFHYQPTVTWDDTAQNWVIVGTSSNGSIWMATFDNQGNFNNDWQMLPGSTPSPAGLAGGSPKRQLACLTANAGWSDGLGVTVDISYRKNITLSLWSEVFDLLVDNPNPGGGYKFGLSCKNDWVMVSCTQSDGVPLDIDLKDYGCFRDEAIANDPANIYVTCCKMM